MVESVNPALPISRQWGLLALPRSSVYRKPAEIDAEDLVIIALIDRHYLAQPYYGSRRMADGWGPKVIASIGSECSGIH